MTVRAAFVLIALSMPIGVACQDSPTATVYTAPAQPRASWVLEPATIGIGDVATLEVAVVTPPNHRIRPFETPTDVPGLWILETETLPVTREPNRWIHRTRVRIRPREVGRFEWPQTPIQIEADGEIQELIAEGISVEVASVIPEHFGRLTPFGLEPLAASPRSGRPWIWAAGGAGFTLACLGLLWLARRESDGERPTARDGGPGIPPWQVALDALDTALDQAGTDPPAACEYASLTLRSYMERRFGSARDVRIIASTTEELAQATPPFAATSRWPGFVDLLQRLDAFRFPAPTGDHSDQVRHARELVSQTADFIRQSIPNEVAR